MKLPDEIFIVVTEHDGDQNYPRPIAWETFLDERCSKSEAIEQVKRLGDRYGKTKIGRLVFDEDKTLDLSDAMAPEEKNKHTRA